MIDFGLDQIGILFVKGGIGWDGVSTYQYIILNIKNHLVLNNSGKRKKNIKKNRVQEKN